MSKDLFFNNKEKNVIKGAMNSFAFGWTVLYIRSLVKLVKDGTKK